MRGKAVLSKLLIAVLSILLIAETAYLLVNRRPIGRFQIVQPGIWMGFDTVTGQGCKLVAEVTFNSADLSEKVYDSLPLCSDIH